MTDQTKKTDQTGINLSVNLNDKHCFNLSKRADSTQQESAAVTSLSRGIIEYHMKKL